MIKTNLDMGNGVVLKDVRVWEVADGMPECIQGLLNKFLHEKIYHWWSSDFVCLSNNHFLDSDEDKWHYFIPLTEIVEAAMRQGEETAYKRYCAGGGGGGNGGESGGNYGGGGAGK